MFSPYWNVHLSITSYPLQNSSNVAEEGPVYEHLILKNVELWIYYTWQKNILWSRYTRWDKLHELQSDYKERTVDLWLYHQRMSRLLYYMGYHPFFVFQENRSFLNFKGPEQIYSKTSFHWLLSGFVVHILWNLLLFISWWLSK